MTGYARLSLGAAVDVIFEIQFTWEGNIDYYHKKGEKFGVELKEAWVPQVAGDFTDDGIVDGRDYVLWRSELGQTGPSLQADGNREYVADINGYNLWRLALLPRARQQRCRYGVRCRTQYRPGCYLSSD
jgi:hypothetical protein